MQQGGGLRPLGPRAGDGGNSRGQDPHQSPATRARVFPGNRWARGWVVDSSLSVGSSWASTTGCPAWLPGGSWGHRGQDSKHKMLGFGRVTDWLGQGRTGTGDPHKHQGMQA